MGSAIGECGRNMSYSCSWPAALGNNESAKPFAAMTADGCNLWRNWHDIGKKMGGFAHFHIKKDRYPRQARDEHR
eukprot:COSAG06_NODE_42556_length_380_cov_1.427046_1_plen_74_part_10